MEAENRPEFKIGSIRPECPGAFGELLSSKMRARIGQEKGIYLAGLASGEFAAGVMAFAAVEEHLEILYLYVAPYFRGCGGGSMLLRTVEEIAAQAAWWVSADFAVVDEETAKLESLFQNAGYTLREDSDVNTYMVTLDECEASESLMKAREDEKLRFFSEVDRRLLNLYTAEAVERSAPLPHGGFNGPDIRPELSVFYEEQGRLKGFVAVEGGVRKSVLRLSAAYNSGENPLMLMWMIKKAFLAAKERYAGKTRIIIDVVDEIAERYVQYVLPEAKEVSRTYDKVPEEA